MEPRQVAAVLLHMVPGFTRALVLSHPVHAVLQGPILPVQVGDVFHRPLLMVPDDNRERGSVDLPQQWVLTGRLQQGAV